MADVENNLTPKQRKAIAALLANGSRREAARAAGVGERTLYRWLADERFSAALDAAKREAFSLAVAHVQHSAADAARTLRALLDESQPAHVRCSAATSILKLARESTELDDHEQRIRALEHKRTPGAEA